jgi:uncharacterized protein (DUF2249 family)
MELTINAETKISQLLEVDRDLVIKTLVQLNKKFAKLNNPIWRNLLIKRVNIAEACKISNTELVDFLWSMKQIGFQVSDESPLEDKVRLLTESFQEPLSYFELDVRPLFVQGKDPLKEILASIKKLREGQGLKLINTFVPLPLIDMLADKGFSHRLEHQDSNTVVTYFSRTSIAAEEISSMPLTEAAGDEKQFDMLLAGFIKEKISYLDVRNLEMPKPMLAILEQTSNLNCGSALFVYHKKIPVYLLPELEKQGLSYCFKTIGPGDVNMLIYKK